MWEMNGQRMKHHLQALLAPALLAALVIVFLWPVILPPAGPSIPPGVTRTRIDLGEQVQLIGYEFSSPTVKAGEPLTVTLYWQTRSFLLTSYKSFVHVTDADGNLVAQSDAVPRNWTYATTGWLPGEWIGDPHVLNVPPSAKGNMQVWAGMYDAETLQRLTPSPGKVGLVKLGVLSTVETR
jgi:hypothetical protein